MRQQLITIPLLNVLVQWIKDRLNEKSNTNHTHGVATTTQDGFMTSADKTKVNAIPANPKYTDTVTTINGKTGAISKSDITALGIPAQDTVYTHPSTHPASMITESTTKRFVSDTEKAEWNGKVDKTGGEMTGALVAQPSGNTRQARNIAIGTTAPTSTTGYSEGDIFLVVP